MPFENMTEQEHFSKYGYVVVRNMISEELTKFIADEFTMMCLFDGGKLNHWRDTYTGKKCIQASLGFANEEINMYDGRKMLGAPGIKGRK